ncbi:tRNA (cytidine(34)-2'-O)-methyltransferase [Rhodoligotrophos defluvii]|uniref:tRNA (cytidine(34)-2'-O)-methyltransferase n=1 Tax=Rhodoligotrophos defluvii TaxID=2561934 RepID=UPI0010C9DB86|nr:tRNA (cytidine(34)-2'-O)-methyltransferase [Rhodoligotrophos defluvii]
MVDIALFQPDIPQNAGTILRLGACLGVRVHIIEPAGFIWSERSFRRAGLDYLDRAPVSRHASFADFTDWAGRRRLVLLTTKAERNYLDARFREDDILLLGRETSGVPDAVHERADLRVTIPMRPGFRSLNVAVACAMVLGEALRQTRYHEPGAAQG